MSLHKAVSKIVERMEKRSKKLLQEGHDTSSLILDSFVDQLHTALEASGDTAPPIPPNDNIAATAFHHKMIAEARKEFKRNASESIPEREEFNELSTKECVGGPAHGDQVVVNPTMPVGAKMFVMGKVYQLQEDNKLHYADKGNIELA